MPSRTKSIVHERQIVVAVNMSTKITIALTTI